MFVACNDMHVMIFPIDSCHSIKELLAGKAQETSYLLLHFRLVVRLSCSPKAYGSGEIGFKY